MSSLFSTDKSVGYARIAVERSVDRYPDGLTYAVPVELGDLKEGERVIVPLGRGDTPTPGFVVNLGSDKPRDVDADALKFILRRDAHGVRLIPQLLELARWISSYYCTPIGMTLATMLPAAVKRNIGSVRKTMIDLAPAPPQSSDAGASQNPPTNQPTRQKPLPPKQQAVLDLLHALPDDGRPVEINILAELANLQSVAAIKKLVERGLLIESYRSVVEAAWAEHATDAREPERLTDEQQHVIDAIASHLDRGFSTHLLFGVTGSGKTEVYIRLIQRVVAAGKVALMLVPEISLTPQTGGRLIGRFPSHRVAILHSGLTAAQRHQQWALVAEGQANIVLGARSAIFAPVADDKLGLIIVDEEHDSSYKQDQAPRYHGRDVAIRRAQLAGCPVVLGSATPSLESWHNAIDDSQAGVDDLSAAASAGNSQSSSAHRRSKYVLHHLRQRAPGLRLPKVQIVDFRDQARQHKDKRVHLLGPALEGAIGRALDAGGQALIFLNRRGYANYIACPISHCGWTMTCDHCDVTVVYHINRKLPLGGYVRCHHCLSEQKLPQACPQCGGKISIFGLGTQRIEEELARKFPQLIEDHTMLRMDSDTMTSARQYHSALRRFGEGEIRVLVGTQMIAKGLDFPGVRVVGVINADTSINLPDFRASERTFQLVSQVAGRCGRGADPGLTIVQTFNPTSPAIRLAADHNFEEFARQELAERSRSALPPMTRMARIVVRDEDHVQCIQAARGLALSLQEIAASLSQAIRLRGPAPCPIARIADKHRQQIEIFAPGAGLMQQFLARARNATLLKSDADMAIDVDPIALL